jgi:alpha-N-arabinofuranosidase
LADQVRRVPNRVKAVAESWDAYLKSMPWLKEKNITFALDEWTGGGWRSGFVRTLCAAEGLHEIFRHSNLITMGGYTAVTSCVWFNETGAAYSSIGLLFKLYRERFGTIPLKVSGNAPQRPVKGTVGVDRPSVSSGSDTYPLDVAAALTGDRKKVTVAVVNPTESVQELNLEFRGARLRGGAELYRIAVPELKTEGWSPPWPALRTETSAVKEMPQVIQAAPFSISLYVIELK